MSSSKELSIIVLAKDLASRALRGVRGELRGIESDARRAASNTVKNLGRIATAAAGLAVVGFGYATKAAADFQQQMEYLHTQAGVSQDAIAGLSKSVLSMSSQVGTSADELAKGLFHIESTGLKGAAALDALKIAAQGAKVGGAGLEETATALAGVLMTGIKGTENMGAAMGALNAIVGAGNMRMEDLVAALSTGIMPSAKAFGLSMTDVGAALAQMADQTVPPEEGATRLRMTIALLGAATPKAAKQLKSIGLGSLDLANDMRKPNGLLTALEDLRDHMVKAHMIGPNGQPTSAGAALLTRAFGGGKSSSGILTLMGNLDLLKQKYDQITKGANQFSDAWAQTQQTAAYQWGQLKTNIQTIAIRIGSVLLPKVNAVVGKLNDWLSTHGSLVDKIAQAGADYFDKLLNFLTGLPWPAITDAFKLMGAGAKLLLDAFLGMPSWVQTAVLTGWGFNKLTGGVLGDIFGKALWGGIKGVLGIKAGVVNVSGGVVNVPGGGVGGLAGGAAAGGGFIAGLGEMTMLGFAGAVASIAALALPLLSPYIFQGPAAPPGSVENPNTTSYKNQKGETVVTGRYGAYVDSLTGNRVGAAVNPGITGAAVLAHGYGQLLGRLPGSAITGGVKKAAETVAKLSADQFLSKLRTTAFIGAKDYKSIFERFTTFKGGGRGTDPTGQGFLRLVEQLKNPKDPKVMTEINGHMRELQSLESYYVQHGDTVNAAKVEQVVAKLAELIGITRPQSATQQAVVQAVREGHAITRRGFQSEMDPLNRIANKKTTVSAHITVPVSVTSVVSIDNVTRKQVAYIRANAGSGGFI